LELRLNSMGCPACRPGYSAAPRAFLDANAAAFCGDCKERAALNPLRVYDCKVTSCRAALLDAPRLPDHLCPACAAHHARVRRCLDIQGIAHTLDHTLVRGMDYYTRTTFEFASPGLGAQSGVGGGGRYDNLIEAIGGPAVPGVGFGTGLERIVLAASHAGVVAPSPVGPVVYVVALSDEGRDSAFSLAHDLRALGVATELDHMSRSAKGQMKQAGRSAAAYAFILGEQEIKNGSVTVRDLRSSEETTVERAQAVALAVRAADAERATGG